MKSRSVKRLSIFGGIVLIGGGLLANYGTGIPQAGAQPATPNPFTVIIDKLNQILTAIGNIPQGNHTLRWDTNNPSASRFVTAFTGAVLDKNTGLVWEQAPSTSAVIWGFATINCAKRNVGGTFGWRLPSVIELKSLQDPALTAPFVPTSVFSGVESAFYWSATTNAGNTGFAWVVNFDTGLVTDYSKGGGTNFVWCVRGPTQESSY